MDFCGCKLERTAGGVLRLHQDEYLKKIKPITLGDKDDPERALSHPEQTSLRTLLGALQWPATQSSPHLSASVSLLCGDVKSASVATAQEANKTLRFAKTNSDACTMFPKLGPLNELCMVAMSDAAWGIRKDSKSQGGYLVVLTHKRVDWRSYKLPRVSRSSLNSESQACAGAMDALEYLLHFWQGCNDPQFELRHIDERKALLPSALVVDAKALYDSLKAEIPQLQGDKRTKIEVMVTKEKMLECGTRLRWVSSEVQLADGATKTSARQLFADRLRTHQFTLVADQTFQASKKKTMSERMANSRRNAVSRMMHKQGVGLAYVIFTSQIVPVHGLSVEDALMQPEVLLSLFVILLSMFGCGLMMFLVRVLSRYVPMTRFELPPRTVREQGVQTASGETGDNETTRILLNEVSRVQSENDRLRREANARGTEASPSPSSIHLARRGERYHTNLQCAALRAATRSHLVSYGPCSYCAGRGG